MFFRLTLIFFSPRPGVASNVEINPGPHKLKFPCGECKKAVKNSENAISCDKCNIWYHKGCLTIGDQVFDCYIQNETLEWTCTKCALNDISTSLFNTSISSVESDIQDDKPKKKSKQLRISVCNFQSIWNKHVLLKHHLSAKTLIY